MLNANVLGNSVMRLINRIFVAAWIGILASPLFSLAAYAGNLPYTGHI